MFWMCSRLFANPGKLFIRKAPHWIDLHRRTKIRPCSDKNMVQPSIKKPTDFQVVLVILWSLVKRLDSHAAVISQGQSHTPLSPPSLLWLYCSFVALAAGGAVRLESPCCFSSYITRLSPILSSFVLSPPSLTSKRQRGATAASSTSPWASLLWWGERGTSALNKLCQKRGRGIFKETT